MTRTELWQGDCLEMMKKIPDGSVDLVLTDPPYGTMKGQGQSPAARSLGLDNCEWDTAIPTAQMFGEIQRILRPNGRCIIFAQEPYTSELINEAIPAVPFLYRAIWVKNTTGNPLKCKKAMLCFYEDICIFSKQHRKHDYAGEHPLRAYFLQEKEKCEGVNFSEVLGNGMASHYFTGGAQFALPTRENYKKLQTTGHFQRDYEEIKAVHDEYQREMIEKMNSENPSVFNLWEGNKYKSNVLQYPKDNDGFHPTQKPVALLEDLIQTYSNAGDMVLDFTMGSGSTGVAAKRTGRNFIGIELSEEYFEIARKRIEETP